MTTKFYWVNGQQIAFQPATGTSKIPGSPKFNVYVPGADGAAGVIVPGLINYAERETAISEWVLIYSGRMKEMTQSPGDTWLSPKIAEKERIGYVEKMDFVVESLGEQRDVKSLAHVFKNSLPFEAHVVFGTDILSELKAQVRFMFDDRQKLIFY